MKKLLVLLLVFLLLFTLVGCSEEPFIDDFPDQDTSQDVDDSEQSGSEDLGGEDTDDENSSTDESEDTVPSGPIGTPVPPIQNGGDYEFN